MTTPRDSGHRAGRIGLIAAVVLAGVFAGGLLVVAIVTRSTTQPEPRVEEPRGPDLGTPEESSTQGVFIQLEDKDDPTRVAGTLSVDTLDPIAAGQYAATGPKAWLYLDDGHSILIRAREGTLFVPQRNRPPERGVLKGGAEVLVYAPVESGATIDPDADAPMIALRTDLLSFDTTLLRFEAPGEFTISGETFLMRSRGLTVVGNDAEDRVDLVEIVNPGTIRYTVADSHSPASPAGAPVERSAGPAPSVNRPASSDAATPPPPARSVPSEQLYRAVFDGQIALDSADAGVRADALDCWVRLLDGRLPEGAIRTVRSATARSAQEPGVTPTNNTTRTPSPRDTTNVGQPPPARADEPREVTLAWEDSLRITPVLAGSPAELKDDHVALRFTASESGLVRLGEAESGLTAHAAAVEYGATRGVLDLSGPSPSSVLVRAPGRGFAELVRVRVDLETGLAHVFGPGVAGLEDAEQGQIRASWIEQADAMLDLAEGAVRGVNELILQGSVRVEGGQLRSSAGVLHAWLDSATSQPTRIQLREHPRVEDENDQSLQARSVIDLHLAVDERGQARPTRVLAEDGVVARRPRESLSCEMLDAELGTDDRGRVTVGAALAEGGVRYVGPDGMSAVADRAEAHGERQQVLLKGERVVVTGRDARVFGTQVALNGKQRSVHVFGAGRFERGEVSDAGRPAPGGALLVWDEEMFFSDADATARCEGNVVAHVVHADGMGEDQLGARRVELTFGDENDDHDDATPIDRPILLAQAVGDGPDRPAEVSWTRFAAPGALGAGQAVDRRMVILGGEILAHGREGWVSVPRAGRLLVTSTRVGDHGAEAELASGDALFTWIGSMRADRTTGQIDFDRGVGVTHRRLADGQATLLDAEHITASFALDDQSAGERSTLTSLVATGAVYAASVVDGRREREIVAERVDYDAASGLARATARAGDLITVVDNVRGTVATASEVLWNVITGQVQMTDPRPIAGAN